MTCLDLWLADALEPEPRRSLIRSAFGLWAITAGLGALLLVVLLGMLAARRARRRAGGTKVRRRRGKPIPDAWTEAGRRAMPIGLDEPPPEVLPDDLPDGGPEDGPEDRS